MAFLRETARWLIRFLAMLLISLVLCPRVASAHRDDYLNETIVYLTLPRGEIEGEYWLDRGHTNGRGDFTRHNAAVEWGITDRWMVDGRFTGITEDGQGTRFDSARAETRYRFSEEGVGPVDLAVSCEVNAERDPDGPTAVGVEPRVILSKDFEEKLNLTVNLSEEIPVRSGSSAFLAAFGCRYNWTNLVRVGSEFQYDFGDHSGSAIPQVWFAFTHDILLKIGYSIGFDQNPDDFARAALEVDF
jgi:hypothetical protein